MLGSFKDLRIRMDRQREATLFYNVVIFAQVLLMSYQDYLN
jgi:hypothetical protein